MATAKKTKKKLQYWGTGRRKKAIARVRLIPGGTGAITINKRTIDEYFGLDTLKLIVRQPLELTDSLNKFDVFVNVCGGGFTGQAGAIRHGIARALVLADAENAQGGGLPDQGSAHQGAQEVRIEEGSQGSSIQKALIRRCIVKRHTPRRMSFFAPSAVCKKRIRKG